MASFRSIFDSDATGSRAVSCLHFRDSVRNLCPELIHDTVQLLKGVDLEVVVMFVQEGDDTSYNKMRLRYISEEAPEFAALLCTGPGKEIGSRRLLSLPAEVSPTMVAIV